MLGQLASIRRSTVATTGAVLFVAIFVTGAVAPLVIPASVVRDVAFGARLSPPSARHWFGTDDFGASFSPDGNTIAFISASPTGVPTLGGSEIPVGVVTALCGAPFFTYLLRRERRRTG